MAVKVERKVVCDFGEGHSGEIRHYRITVDGESKAFDLCSRCAAPVTKLLARGGVTTPAPGRGQVFTMSEIEARKQKKPPASE